jgi:hypothetical protein
MFVTLDGEGIAKLLRKGICKIKLKAKNKRIKGKFGVIV